MILHRYIIKNVLLATLFVVLVMLGLMIAINLLGELRDIGIGDYGFWQAVEHVFLQLPYHLYNFFPMLVLLGGLMGLGALASHQELVVMRTAGFSVIRIMIAVMIAALILITIATVIGEAIAPSANFFANKRKDNQQNAGQAVATAAGVWIHQGNNFLHIRRVMGAKYLEGITRYEFNDSHQLLAAYYANSAKYENQQWVLQDLVKTTFSNNQTSRMQYPESLWDLKLNPSLINIGLIQPEEMTLPHLVEHSERLVQNGLQSNRFELEFWKRVLQPLATLVMILLAVPLIFAAPRSASMGWRLLLGLIVGLVFYILNALLGQISVVYQVSPFLAAILPTILFAFVGFLVLKQKNL
ncbi:hypothetical protein AYO45_06775 [Gammaproteobacteria bacterium SCGC AG-212-F23]|nr:hypothetical protein AYO45_06775 [Gammaproteobacteria bacterium SCGC AG-212-F23]